MSEKQAFSEINLLPDKDPVRYLTWGYIVALAIIGLMSISIHTIINRIVAEQDSVVTIIGSSAEQTTLAQQVALRATIYASSPTDGARKALVDAAAVMKTRHDDLIREGLGPDGQTAQVPEALLAIYFSPPYELHDKVTIFLDRVDQLLAKKKSVLSVNDGDYLAVIDQVEGPLGASLKAALSDYEEIIIGKINKLQSFQRLAIFVILSTLLAEALLIFMPLISRVRKYADELKKITLTDLLTGIGNRRYFNYRGHEEIQRCRRLNRELTLALIDLDRFKEINDSYGHKSGDMVLQQFVKVVRKCMRFEDVFARLGGEEFAILLPHTALADAERIVERMRHEIEIHEFTLDRDFKASITMSAGVTRVNLSHDDFEASMVLADVALYDAKRSGRNKVVAKQAENFFEDVRPPENVVPLKPT